TEIDAGKERFDGNFVVDNRFEHLGSLECSDSLGGNTAANSNDVTANMEIPLPSSTDWTKRSDSLTRGCTARLYLVWLTPDPFPNPRSGLQAQECRLRVKLAVGRILETME